LVNLVAFLHSYCDVVAISPQPGFFLVWEKVQEFSDSKEALEAVITQLYELFSILVIGM
jgi:hypothetical protein